MIVLVLHIDTLSKTGTTRYPSTGLAAHDKQELEDALKAAGMVGFVTYKDIGSGDENA